MTVQTCTALLQLSVRNLQLQRGKWPPTGTHSMIRRAGITIQYLKYVFSSRRNGVSEGSSLYIGFFIRDFNIKT